MVVASTADIFDLTATILQAPPLLQLAFLRMPYDTRLVPYLYAVRSRTHRRGSQDRSADGRREHRGGIGLQMYREFFFDESFAALDPETMRLSLDCVLARAHTAMVIVVIAPP